MRKKDTEYTEKFRKKSDAQRVVIDLYRVHEDERKVAEILNEQKEKKQLKQFVIDAIMYYVENKKDK